MLILVILQNKIKSNIISIQTIQAYLDLPRSSSVRVQQEQKFEPKPGYQLMTVG